MTCKPCVETPTVSFVEELTPLCQCLAVTETAAIVNERFIETLEIKDCAYNMIDNINFQKHCLLAPNCKEL